MMAQPPAGEAGGKEGDGRNVEKPLTADNQLVIGFLQWCHQSFDRVIEWWCMGIYIFILTCLEENLHFNQQELF